MWAQLHFLQAIINSLALLTKPQVDPVNGRQVNTWSCWPLLCAKDVAGLRSAIPTHVGNLLPRIKAAEPADEQAEGTPTTDLH